MALAPVCSHCGVVITGTGGTLGMTSAYGVNDLTFTRRRVEADLAVCVEYRRKYEGMTEACIQQLAWGAERYAQLPKPPELLEVRKTWSFFEFSVCFFAIFAAGSVIWWVVLPFYYFYNIDWRGLVIFGHPILVRMDYRGPGVLDFPADFRIFWFNLFKLIIGTLSAGVIYASWCFFSGDIQTRVANGKRPQENARRQQAFNEATTAALKDAERKKLAEDHRLGLQIRELDGLVKTMGAKEADVRRILATL